MSINPEELFTDMLNAAKKSLLEDRADIFNTMDDSIKKFRDKFVEIEKLLKLEKITPEAAKMQIQFQKKAILSKLILLSEKNKLAIENAINATLEIAKTAVNKSLGISVF